MGSVVYLKRMPLPLGNQGNPKERILQTGLLDHCIFCLQKTDGGGGGGGSGDGEVVTVTKAMIRPRFIQNFNEVWQHLRSLKRIAAKTNLLSPEIPKFDLVPTICQSCANLTQYVAELLQNLRLRVGQLKDVITEARERGGGDCWRFENFERNLKESTVFGKKSAAGGDGDHIRFVLKFIETLDSIPVDENIKVNQPSKNRKAPTETKSKQGGVTGDQAHHPQTVIPSNLDETSTSSSVNEPKKSAIKIENENGDVVMEFHPEPEDTTTQKEKSANDLDSDYNPLEDPNDAQDDTSASDQDDTEDINLSASPSNNYNQSSSASAQIQEDISNYDDYTLAVSTTANTAFQDIFICEHKNCGKSFIGKGAYSHHKSIYHSEKNLKFTCSQPTCGKKFRTLNHLREHMKKNLDTHPLYHVQFSKMRYPCDMCGEPLPFSKEHAKEHLKTHLGGELGYIVECPIEKCSQLFTTTSGAFHHLSFRHQTIGDISKIKKAFGSTCETCGYVGANRLSLKGHLNRCHERGEDKDKVFKCPVENCGERFFVRQAVDIHLERHRSKVKRVTKKQRCEICQEEIKVEEMTDHLKSLHGEVIKGIFECDQDQCPCVYGSEKGLLEHLYEHRKGKCLYCFICKDGRRYGKHCDLRWHFGKEHGIEGEVYSCELCDKKFNLKGSLQSHVSRDHQDNKGEGKRKEKKWKCDECPPEGEEDVRFDKEESLITHKIKVHGAAPFKCEECEGEKKEFSSLVDFNRHKRKEHLGIVGIKKEWVCEEGEGGCGKIFPNRGKLRVHKERSHGGGEKSFVCDACGKAFFDRASLRHHNDKIHLGLRPWVCEECGERFGDGGVLRTHMLIHTGERPFGCEICGQRFRHDSVLRTHIKGHVEKGERFKPNGPMKRTRKRKAQ